MSGRTPRALADQLTSSRHVTGTLSGFEEAGGPTVIRAQSANLDAAGLSSVRALMAAAFGGGFSDDDWANALGGTHFMVREGGTVIAHASVVERRLEIGEHSVRAGYVEAVATIPGRRRQGLGAAIMQAIGLHIKRSYEIGALSTSAHRFYERLGWERWQGQSFVRTEFGRVRTQDEDDGIMVLKTRTTPAVRVEDAITCEWRPGDVW
jgi:aminoglycoside 2'-N-acetyltransferase I